MSTDTYLHGKCTHKIIHTNACETKKVYFDTLEAFSLCPSYSLFILFSETFFVTLKKWSKMFSKKRNNFGIFSPQAILVDSPASESLIAIEIAKNLSSQHFSNFSSTGRQQLIVDTSFIWPHVVVVITVFYTTLHWFGFHVGSR